MNNYCKICGSMAFYNEKLCNRCYSLHNENQRFRKNQWFRNYLIDNPESGEYIKIYRIGSWGNIPAFLIYKNKKIPQMDKIP